MYLTENNILSPYQHGFREGMSTITQLVTIHDISMVLGKGGQVDMLFLDFCKAFDKVSHSKLLLKLELIGLPDYLIDWIASYLKNRTIC